MPATSDIVRFIEKPTTGSGFDMRKAVLIFFLPSSLSSKVSIVWLAAPPSPLPPLLPAARCNLFLRSLCLTMSSD